MVIAHVARQPRLANAYNRGDLGSGTRAGQVSSTEILELRAGRSWPPKCARERTIMSYSHLVAQAAKVFVVDYITNASIVYYSTKIALQYIISHVHAPISLLVS